MGSTIENKPFIEENSTEKVTNKIEKKEKEIPVIKYEEICKEIWTNKEFKEKICTNCNNNFLSWLEKQWFDFIALTENKGLKLDFDLA